MAHIVQVHNTLIPFVSKSLTLKDARGLIAAINLAYMHCLVIACKEALPATHSDAQCYVAACQLVHDNLADVTEGVTVRNDCLMKLKA